MFLYSLLNFQKYLGISKDRDLQN
ncbi:MAG: hypothetical protein JWQ25_2769, partial [Daejeonella sp.]|nr:hypothetical protein [Daejeonella sp.]